MNQNKKPQMFWMVKSENTNETKYMHPTSDNAINEAKRLAKEFPGTKFFVLSCIGYALCKDPVEFHETEFDQIPF